MSPGGRSGPWRLGVLFDNFSELVGKLDGLVHLGGIREVPHNILEGHCLDMGQGRGETLLQELGTHLEVYPSTQVELVDLRHEVGVVHEIRLVRNSWQSFREFIC